ncbi:hypothetical protein [Candidatus Poriferisodalis sp.]|uniref:hypothetical protein n=1 Tax=Candidatus Poriferisodalis sp. TaxID=3101277 RepID=UPI003B02C712
MLAEFRARLVRAGMESFWGDRVKIAAKRAGVIGHRRTVDSAGIEDCVLTQDTVTLIRSQVRRCVGVLGALDAAAAGEAAGSLSRGDYDRAAKPRINWSDPGARAALAAELFGDAETVVGFRARFEDPELTAAAELLRVVAGQDIETAAGADSDMITSAAATQATAHDATVPGDLIDADPVTWTSPTASASSADTHPAQPHTANRPTPPPTPQPRQPDHKTRPTPQ